MTILNNCLKTILVVLLTSTYLTAQSDLAKRVDLTKYQPGFHDTANLRVWGWSGNEAVAYSFVEENDARGGTQIQYYIQDLVTDKILWHFEDDSNDWGSQPDKGVSIDEHSWNLNKNSIQSVFNQYNIVLTSTVELIDNVMHNGLRYTPSVVIVETRKRDEQLYDVKFTKYETTFRIEVNTSAGTRKTIAENKVSARRERINVHGMIKSPFQNKVLVIVSAVNEEPLSAKPNVYFLAGCNLISGFK